MPIYVDWSDTDDDLILARFEGFWTVEEFQRTISDMEAMTADLPHQVYAIAHADHSEGVPRAGNLLPDMRRMFALPVAHFVAVPSSEIATIILEVFTRLRPQWQSRVTFVDTLDEAFAVVEEKRSEANE